MAKTETVKKEKRILVGSNFIGEVLFETSNGGVMNNQLDYTATQFMNVKEVGPDVKSIKVGNKVMISGVDLKTVGVFNINMPGNLQSLSVVSSLLSKEKNNSSIEEFLSKPVTVVEYYCLPEEFVAMIIG